jgi:hypothetical protein
VPESRPIATREVQKFRISMTDVLWALFLVAWTAFGVNGMSQDVATYRFQQKVFAAQHGPIPKMVGEVPYDPTVDRRLIGEAAGCVITLAVVFFGIRRHRHRIVETRVKWIPTPSLRVVATPQARAAPAHDAKSGSMAADRLSAVVWTDQVVRREKEHA